MLDKLFLRLPNEICIHTGDTDMLTHIFDHCLPCQEEW